MKSYTMISIMNQLFEQIVKNRRSEYDTEENIIMPFKENEGIHFCVKVDADNFGYEKDGNTYHPEWKKRVIKYFHVIMLYPHCILL